MDKAQLPASPSATNGALMSIDDADHQARALVPTTMKAAIDLAEYLAKSSLMPKALANSPQNCFVVIMQGLELGLAPMAAIRGIYVVDGKPTLASALLVALVQRSGKAKYFNIIEWSEKRCIVETHRVGDPQPQRAQFTIEEAKHLMHKDNWKAYPTDMLLARAQARLVRAKFQDVTFGLPSYEDAMDMVESSPGVFSPASVVTPQLAPMGAAGAPAVSVPIPVVVGQVIGSDPVVLGAAVAQMGAAPPPGVIEAAIVGPTTTPDGAGAPAMTAFEELTIKIGEAADTSALTQLATKIKDAHEKAKSISDDERRQLRDAYSLRWKTVTTSGGAA